MSIIENVIKLCPFMTIPMMDDIRAKARDLCPALLADVDASPTEVTVLDKGKHFMLIWTRGFYVVLANTNHKSINDIPSTVVILQPYLNYDESTILKTVAEYDTNR